MVERALLTWGEGERRQDTAFNMTEENRPQAPAGQRGEYFLLRSQTAKCLKGKIIEHLADLVNSERSYALVP